MDYKNQLVYGEEGLVAVEEVLKKLGFEEATVAGPHSLRPGQYFKATAAGGSFTTPIGIFNRAWNVYWLAKE